MIIIRNNILAILSIIIFSVGSVEVISAQSDYSVPKTRELFLNFPDSMLKLNILAKPFQAKRLHNEIYYWYSSEMIFCNRGSFSGSLLHGRYCVYDKKKRLIQEGHFHYGLKEGIWKSWYENGELKSSVTWKKGSKYGEAVYYDKYGKMQQRANYKNDFLNGLFTYYKGKEEINVRYKKGIEIKKKPKVQVLKRTNKSVKNNSTSKETLIKKPRRKVLKKPNESLENKSSSKETSIKKPGFMGKLFKKKKPNVSKTEIEKPKAKSEQKKTDSELDQQKIK